MLMEHFATVFVTVLLFAFVMGIIHAAEID